MTRVLLDRPAILAVALAVPQTGLRHHGEIDRHTVEVAWWRPGQPTRRSVHLIADLTGIGVRRWEPGHAVIERRVDASVPGWDLASLLTRDLAWLQDAPKSPETARPAIDTGCEDGSIGNPNRGRKAGEGL